jgi:high affinity Mn2+ porin
MWTARLEYLSYGLDDSRLIFPTGSPFQSSADFQSLRLGLNRKLPWQNAEADVPMAQNIAPSQIDWQIHGQITYIQQGYPAFHALYSGPQSLSPNAQTKNTASATAFIGLRPWEGAEVFFAPEIAQGFGLSGTLGLAGFPNGEAQKAGFPYPHYNTSRAFIRQTFGLGGEQEDIESDTVHMGGKVDVSRVSITAGRIFLPDFIDNNAYADEPRTTFLNWSIWAAGAFDFPADQLGYSWGAIVELNQKDWAIRAGYLLMPSESNSNYFDMKLVSRGEYLIEMENRYSLFGLPGKLRSIGWINSAFTGSFSETLANPFLNLDITQTRRGRLKYGYVFNLEQSLTDNIGLFGRWSWNDGKTETMAFTDINASLSAGLSIKGRSWGRPEDTIGIAGAINSISPSFRNFVAAGGTGVLIGDGQLNYRKEDILETYYSIKIYKETRLTLDYQFIANPAYNADRGPVSVFSGRFHSEF